MNFYVPYLKKYKYSFMVGLLCVSLEAFCDLLGPTLMAKVINKGIEAQSVNQVVYWASLMLFVTGIGACFALIRNILASRVSQGVGADIRSNLFAKIMRFSEQSADKIEAGSLITRLTNDTTQITQFINGTMRIFLKAPLVCFGSIILAALLNYRLAFIIYAVVGIVTLCIVISMKISYPLFAKLQKATDKLNETVQEFLAGIRLIKAFGNYVDEKKSFNQANSAVYKTGITSQYAITFLSPIMTFTVGFGVLSVLYWGAHLFAHNQTQIGDISAFIVYLSQILTSLIMITNIFNTFVRTKASTKRICEVMDSPEDFTQNKKNGERKQLNFERLNGSIRFENVSFAYPAGSGLNALSNISFQVDEGKSLSIIGPTGSGKSTIANLLLRFYDVDSGEVYIDEKNIQSIDVNVVRKNVSLVTQKASLFTGSIEENIRWGNPEALPLDVEAALKTAQADFVYTKPQGLQSPIEAGATNFSGGQKQRISIARALVKQSPILILDDATSALDTLTEAKLLHALQNDIKKCTRLVITQRCATAIKTDLILVLENGFAAGLGTHSELLKTCKVYQDMYYSQIEAKNGE